MNTGGLKSPAAFRTISEASAELGVPSHVLRFWETKFSFIRPMKRAGGRRFYRPRDLDVLKGVRALLHEEGYTIKGVQRLHKEQGVQRLLMAGGVDAEIVAALGDDADGSILGEGPDAHPPQQNEAIVWPELEIASDRAPMRAVDLMLDDAARRRLEQALLDLERAKVAIDQLLRPG